MSDEPQTKVEEENKDEDAKSQSSQSSKSEEEEKLFEEKKDEEKKEEEGKKYSRPIVKRRQSLYEGFDEKQEFFRPEYHFDSKDPVKEKMWELMDAYLSREKLSIQKSIVNHIEDTLARTRFQIDDSYIFQGTALSVRDRLLEQLIFELIIYHVLNMRPLIPTFFLLLDPYHQNDILV